MTKEIKKKTTKKKTTKNKFSTVEEAFLLWLSTKDEQPKDKDVLDLWQKSHVTALNEVINFEFTSDMNLRKQKAAAFVLSLSEKDAKKHGIAVVQENLKGMVYRVLAK